MVGIQHKDLLKKVRNYEEILTKSKLTSLDFFIPSEYQGQNAPELYSLFYILLQGVK